MNAFQNLCAIDELHVGAIKSCLQGYLLGSGGFKWNCKSSLKSEFFIIMQFNIALGTMEEKISVKLGRPIGHLFFFSSMVYCLLCLPLWLQMSNFM